VVEINLGVIVACIPTFGPLFKNLFTRVSSSMRYPSNKNNSSNKYASARKSIRLKSWADSKSASKLGSRNDVIEDCDGTTWVKAHRAESTDSQEAMVKPSNGVVQTRSYTVEVETRHGSVGEEEIIGMERLSKVQHM
jgi:hypothetical protein